MSIVIGEVDALVESFENHHKKSSAKVSPAEPNFCKCWEGIIVFCGVCGTEISGSAPLRPFYISFHYFSYLKNEVGILYSKM
jgi:hypothetical protein